MSQIHDWYIKHEQETLYNLTVIEATNLKANATPEELAKLDFSTLNVDTQDKCIYGQMTGKCYSERATELIILCATEVYKGREEWRKETVTGLHQTRYQLGGKPYPVEQRAFEYHSPMERFLFWNRNPKVNNKILIDFLQGRIDTLTFV
jgi:hypothetical protein